MTRNAREEEKSSADVHRANLYSLISCVDALAALHDRLQLEKNTRGWPLTKNIYEEVNFILQTIVSCISLLSLLFRCATPLRCWRLKVAIFLYDFVFS